MLPPKGCLDTTIKEAEYGIETTSPKYYEQDHTGVIISPTQTRHYYYKGNPSKLPYICCLFDPSKIGNLMTPATYAEGDRMASC